MNTTVKEQRAESGSQQPGPWMVVVLELGMPLNKELTAGCGASDECC